VDGDSTGPCQQDTIPTVRHLRAALSRYKQDEWQSYRSHLGLHLRRFLEEETEVLRTKECMIMLRPDPGEGSLTGQG
jgi:hypothetical protein